MLGDMEIWQSFQIAYISNIFGLRRSHLSCILNFVLAVSNPVITGHFRIWQTVIQSSPVVEMFSIYC